MHQPVFRLHSYPGCMPPQGKEAVPEAVDHVLVPVDPREDRSWLQSQPPVPTDNAHKYNDTGPKVDSVENWSQAVKKLKPRVLQRLIDAHKCGPSVMYHGHASITGVDLSRDKNQKDRASQSAFPRRCTQASAWLPRQL